MADGALAPIRRRGRKKEGLSKKVIAAIELLASGEVETQKEAAERVGMTATWLCTRLNSPEGRAVLHENAMRTFSHAGPRAARRIAHLMVGAQSEKVAFEAAKHILAVEGIQPVKQGTNINVGVQVSAGYVIKLDGSKSGPPTIGATTIIDSDAT